MSRSVVPNSCGAVAVGAAAEEGSAGRRPIPKVPSRHVANTQKNRPRGSSAKSRHASPARSRQAAKVGSAWLSNRASSTVIGVASAIPRIAAMPRPALSNPAASVKRRPASAAASGAANGAASAQPSGPRDARAPAWSAMTAEPSANSTDAAISSSLSGSAVTAAAPAMRQARASAVRTSRPAVLPAPRRASRNPSVTARVVSAQFSPGRAAYSQCVSHAARIKTPHHSLQAGGGAALLAANSVVWGAGE